MNRVEPIGDQILQPGFEALDQPGELMPLGDVGEGTDAVASSSSSLSGLSLLHALCGDTMSSARFVFGSEVPLQFAARRCIARPSDRGSLPGEVGWRGP